MKLRGKVLFKYFKQCLIVLIEIGFASWLIVFVLFRNIPASDFEHVIGRYVTAVAIYEIFVYITLNFIIDAKRDALLAYRTALELARLAVSINNKELKNSILEKIDKG